jgi:endonuclease III
VVHLKIKNHQAVAHSTTTLARIRRVRKGLALSGVHKTFGAAYRLLQSNLPAPTVTRSGFRDFVHPRAERLCTVRELARLQSFPDSHHFAGRRCDTYAKSRYVKQTQHEQVGNAVPPVLAAKIAKAIRSQLLDNTDEWGTANRKRAFRRVFARLDRAFPQDRLGNFSDPLDELIFIMLSRRARWNVYQPVFASVKKRYRRWEKALEATTKELRTFLQPLGLVNQRIRDVRGVLTTIKKDFGSVSLSPLRRMSSSAAYNYLRSLSGVNDKSAKCVMYYALGHGVLPIDTHTFRVSKRLGILPRNTSFYRAPKILDRVIPPDYRGRYHVLTVLLGRQFCTPTTPDCPACPMRRHCRASSAAS